MPLLETLEAAFPKPPLAGLLAGGALLGLIVSTQYLFQPFVWNYWPVDEVLLGWLEVLRDRVVVGLSMAAALWWALHRHTGGSRVSATGLGLAMVAGAAGGELVLMAMDAPQAAVDGVTWFGRVLRWGVVAAVLVASHRLWMRHRAQDEARQRAQRERHEAGSQLAQMRLLALRAQIEPHFLFNTLATAQRLAQTDRTLGVRLLDHLVAFVRLSAEAGPEPHAWTVGRELELVRAYLGVIEMRMDGRLEIAVHATDDVLCEPFPPLMLATLVENAVKHGIAKAPHGGAIEVSVRSEARALHAEVRDTGLGFTAQAGAGMGLANTRARLRTMYGSAASLQLRANRPSGVVAALWLPRAEGMT